MKRILILLVFFFSSINASVPVQIVEDIEYILSREKINPIIAIGGCPGVGKSTLANLLVEELAQKNIRSIRQQKTFVNGNGREKKRKQFLAP